ncbi:hypothetical protein PG997_007270 [Apiospora hydei]|uniref:Uncharacterized protein n=1 Tax=Apiospora hydei TaxID=1337664 RepID=A0ABR1W7S2_9PEZI
MFDVAGLLLQKTLWASCWRFRHTDKFRQQLQRLMRPVFCAGCERFHPRIHFSELREGFLLHRHGITCIGRYAVYRVCAHKQLDFDEYVEACEKSGFRCDKCDATVNTTTRAVQTRLPLVQVRRDEAAMSSIRTRLEQSELRQACPHIRLPDPAFLEYLFRAIRTNGPTDVEQCQSEPVERPLLNHGGLPWGCRIYLDLIVSRPILSMRSPVDFNWLAHRDNTGDSHTADARGITWCPDPTCGTSKGRRKEALLFRLLEAALDAPPRCEWTAAG